MKAATSSGNTAIAVRGSKSAAFITQKKVPVSLRCLHRLVVNAPLMKFFITFCRIN